jgi:hypothetical protein
MVIVPGILLVVVAISILVIIVAPGVLVVIFAPGILVVVIALGVLAVNNIGKGPVFVIIGNGCIVISASAARLLHSIFHRCLQLSLDCCVCFPNWFLTKLSTSNITHSHMDQFLLFSWCATFPQTE